MRTVIETSPNDQDHACQLLEALAEGIVLSDMLEISAEDDEDEVFPCCIKCGQFRLIPDRQIVDGARIVAKNKGGNAMALACYQVAQIRREKDSRADVVVDFMERNGVPIPGQFRFLIRRGDGSIEDPLAEVVRNGPCPCKERSEVAWEGRQ